MVYTVACRDGGLKIVDDDKSVCWLDRKYSDNTYWKCEIRQHEAVLQTILENNTSVTMVTKLSEKMRYSITMSYTFPTELWNVCEQTCDNTSRMNSSAEVFHSTVQKLSKCASYYLENWHFSQWRKTLTMNFIMNFFHV